MKKAVCPTCEKRMDKHLIRRIAGRLTWVCPPLD